MLGTVIKAKKEHRKALKVCSGIIEEAGILMSSGASKRKAALERLWKLINKLYPETVDYECSFNHEKYEIVVIRKLKN